MLIPSDPVHAFLDYPDVAVANASGGPLAGLTFAVKDIYDVAGYITGCGSREKMADGVPAAKSAPAVARLLAAGARFVGKTHTAELAFSLDGRNERLGTPLNPAAPGRVPGGSSSGSAAAVAAGLVDLALGSDTGGSVRGPASFCGIIGLRPTFGRIDIAGAMPLAPTFDTVGWFTRDIGLYERVGAVMLGEDVAGPSLARLIVAEDAFALLSGEAETAALRPAVKRVTDRFATTRSETVAPDGLNGWQQIYRTMQGYEAWQAHGQWIQQRKPDLNPAARTRFELASRVTATEYRDAAALRAIAARRVLDLVGDDGVLVVPTMPGIAPLVAAPRRRIRAFPGAGDPDHVHRRDCRAATGVAADGESGRLSARPVADRTARQGPRASVAGAGRC